MNIIFYLKFKSSHHRTQRRLGPRIVEIYDAEIAKGVKGRNACCSYNEEVSNLTLLRVVLSSPYLPPSTYRVVLSPPSSRCNLRPHRSTLVYLDAAEVIA
jgi:hypothetical protein